MGYNDLFWAKHVHEAQVETHETWGVKFYIPPHQKFRKGLADRGGWRKEILQKPEIQASFLYPFSYAPLGEGDTFLENFIGSFCGGLFVANPLPPTPFQNL